MKKYYFYLLNILLFFCLTLATTVSNAQTPNPFSKIVFFGDSLTDNGNLYYTLLGFMPKSPPYYHGRFSNGIVWSEHVDQYYLNKNSVQTVNYAVGGQTTIFHDPLKGYLPYTITMSLDLYLLHTLFQDRSHTLFIIWIGANDYLPGPENLDQLSTSVTDTIKATIESLIYHGGTNFLVLNLPDLSKAPFAKSTNYEEALKAATIIHNLKLDAVMSELQNDYKTINIQSFNTNALLNDFMDHIEKYNEKYNTHINNTTESCWRGGYTLAKNKSTESDIAREFEVLLQSKTYTPTRTKDLDANDVAHFIVVSPALFEAYKVGRMKGMMKCDFPDQYLFWDKVHPSATSHLLISKLMIEFIDQHYIPAQSP